MDQPTRTRDEHIAKSRVQPLVDSARGTRRAKPETVSRRRIVAGGAAAAGAVLLGGALRRPAEADESGHGLLASPAPSRGWETWKPTDLIEPEVRRSSDGLLETDLLVDYLYHDIGGYRLHPRGYENGIPGPTLRLQPGDTLRITLTNNLPQDPEPAPAEMDLPHGFNTTNFHAHGMHVSPEGISDNIFRTMSPGEQYEIEIAVPADHPRGSYWYHPHHHGSADLQLTSGMFGALIVEDDGDSDSVFAEFQERVLIVSEVLFDHQGQIEHYETVWPEAVPRFLAINGQREPIVRMRPGEIQRWRFVQAAHESNLRLALEGHQLHAVAYDGIGLPRIETLESLNFAPGQRADLLIRAGEPGTYELAAIANDQGYPSPEGPLARLVVEGEPLAMALPGTLPPPPLAAITDDELTGDRLLTLSVIEPEYPPAADYQEFAYLVDGKQFDPERVDQLVTLGAVEEWTIVNEHEDDHIFHIHTNPFQMTHVNNEALAEPVWRDSVIVPRKGNITYRSRFLDFTGKLVLHCHMMNHEELGMMQVVEIVSPG